MENITFSLHLSIYFKYIISITRTLLKYVSMVDLPTLSRINSYKFFMSISVIIYWSTNPSVKKGTEVLQVFLESWFVKSKLTIHFFQHFLNYMQQTQLFHIRKLIQKEQSQCWEHYFPNFCKPRWMPEDRKRIIGNLIILSNC